MRWLLGYTGGLCFCFCSCNSKVSPPSPPLGQATGMWRESHKCNPIRRDSVRERHLHVSRRAEAHTPTRCVHAKRMLWCARRREEKPRHRHKKVAPIVRKENEDFANPAAAILGEKHDVAGVHCAESCLVSRAARSVEEAQFRQSFRSVAADSRCAHQAWFQPILRELAGAVRNTNNRFIGCAVA